MPCTADTTVDTQHPFGDGYPSIRPSYNSEAPQDEPEDPTPEQWSGFIGNTQAHLPFCGYPWSQHGGVVPNPNNFQVNEASQYVGNFVNASFNVGVSNLPATGGMVPPDALSYAIEVPQNYALPAVPEPEHPRPDYSHYAVPFGEGLLFPFSFHYGQGHGVPAYPSSMGGVTSQSSAHSSRSHTPSEQGMVNIASSSWARPGAGNALQNSFNGPRMPAEPALDVDAFGLAPMGTYTVAGPMSDDEIYRNSSPYGDDVDRTIPPDTRRLSPEVPTGSASSSPAASPITRSLAIASNVRRHTNIIRPVMLDNSADNLKRIYQESRYSKLTIEELSAHFVHHRVLADVLEFEIKQRQANPGGSFPAGKNIGTAFENCVKKANQIAEMNCNTYQAVNSTSKLDLSATTTQDPPLGATSTGVEITPSGDATATGPSSGQHVFKLDGKALGVKCSSAKVNRSSSNGKRSASDPGVTRNTTRPSNSTNASMSIPPKDPDFVKRVRKRGNPFVNSGPGFPSKKRKEKKGTDTNSGTRK